MTHTELPPELLAAYRTTEYWVGEGERAFCLRVGHFSEALARLLRATGTECAAYITAHNPFSNASTVHTNEMAHEHLRKELARRCARLVEGAGRDPADRWPAEESFLAIGLGLDASKEIGIQFRQNAIVWAGCDAIPRLILLR